MYDQNAYGKGRDGWLAERAWGLEEAGRDADYGMSDQSRENPNRVIRGGSWNYSARNCRSAIRYRRRPDDRDGNCGFRVCLVPQCTSRIRSGG
ncbi:MAG: SUMF1/EgtB/PvdO family nonheme iron enzyme, partial [Verrucomicrobiota bacterium]